jgi:SAM-dependent methyltransferase
VSGVLHPGGPLDFRGIDFDRLWRGREKTTAVEQRLVTWALEHADRRRLIELGPGGGRITEVLLRPGTEYIGADVTAEFLGPLRARWPQGTVWIAADLADLPLGDGTLTAAVFVRVYNFLEDPARAMGELARVLTPGGRLLVSYFPYPSFGSLWNDLRRGLREPTLPAVTPVSGPSGLPTTPTRAAFRRTATAAGFVELAEFACGLEDLRPAGRLPEGILLGLAEGLGHASALPHHFVLLGKPGASPATLPPLPAIWRCPDCRQPLPWDRPAAPAPGRCPGCGRSWEAAAEGIPDLRPSSSFLDRSRTPPVAVR